MIEGKLTQTQIENLIDLVAELQAKLKKKTEHLTMARQRVNRAKRTIVRLKGVIAYQRGRILNLHRGQDMAPGRFKAPKSRISFENGDPVKESR